MKKVKPEEYKPRMQSDNVIVPAFLNKLWNMVNEPYTDNLICWSEDGKSFIIQNQALFWYDLLPQYYKHNNMSSFVRQLNMYGFHKKSSSDNATLDTDKDEIQFYHPYFQKGHQELLKNIKRKAAGSTKVASVEPIAKVNWQSEDLTNVLADVKSIKGKQASVDSQLLAMKHENAVLWRELAVLRQKHLTQQKIVNKLIQFLVTIVQPTRVGGLGMKRHYQLMLNDVSQAKKKKASPTPSDGPTIHELDTSSIPQEEFFVENLQSPEDIIVKSPSTSSQASANSPLTTRNILEDPIDVSPVPPNILLENIEIDPTTGEPAVRIINPDEFINVKFEDASENTQLKDLLHCNMISNDNLNQVLPDMTENIPIDIENELAPNSTVFLNPNSQDTLLTNLVPGNYNAALLNGDTSNKKQSIVKKEVEKKKGKDLAVATREPGAIVQNANDLDIHLESTQSELEQLKELLNGCNSFDANALLGLFSDDSFPYELSYSEDQDHPREDNAGRSELAISNPQVPEIEGNELIDFSQLLDDAAEDATCEERNADPMMVSLQDLETLNTPQINVTEPIFPSPGSVSSIKYRKAKQ